MKTYILTVCAMALGVVVIAQNIPQTDVPSAVKTALQSKFKDVTDVEWEIDNDQYKAEFKVGKRGHDVWIDKSGNITKLKQDFPKSQLPAAILDKIKTDFKDYAIDDADKIETEGKVFYKVDLESKTGEDREVWFTPDGKIQERVKG